MTISVRRFLPLVGMTLDAVKEEGEGKGWRSQPLPSPLPNLFKVDCHSERSDESPDRVGSINDIFTQHVHFMNV